MKTCHRKSKRKKRYVSRDCSVDTVKWCVTMVMCCSTDYQPESSLFGRQTVQGFLRNNPTFDHACANVTRSSLWTTRQKRAVRRALSRVTLDSTLHELTQSFVSLRRIINNMKLGLDPLARLADSLPGRAPVPSPAQGKWARRNAERRPAVDPVSQKRKQNGKWPAGKCMHCDRPV